jgi:hypothetical protein
MTKSALGLTALVSLGLGLVIMGSVAIFNPYGGHSVAGWVLLSFFLIALGVVLGIVHFIRRAIARGRGQQ